MNVTRFTDYGLRVLIYLAVDPERLVTIKEVAERYAISRNHLMKVVQELSAQNYITALRGKNGGIKLSRPAEQINIGKLVRLLERDTTLVECFGAKNECVITPACQLKMIFDEAMQAFFTSLEAYTLSDLCGTSHHDQLAQLLQIDTHRSQKAGAG